MLNRKLAPPFQKTLSVSLPKPIEITLPSGVKLFLVSGVQQNVAKVEVVFSAGKWVEPKIGLSHFTASLLEKGTKSKTAEVIANELDYYGASLEISAGYDFVSVALYSLKSQWKHIFPLFLEIIREPIFPEKEWALMKDIFLQSLKINNEKTSYRASGLIRKNIFGASHPYGSSIEAEDVARVGVSDFRDFFCAGFRVHSIYGVGNFDEEELREMTQGFQALPGAGQSRTVSAAVVEAPAVTREEKAGGLQSSIRLGKRAPMRTDPDYFELLVFNHLFGGFFGSRLMKNIREEKGLTYGIYSSLNSFAHAGVFIIGADVNKVNLDLAVTEIRNELQKIGATPVGEEELILARNHFAGSLQADMANLFSVIEKIKNIQLHGLPASYYEDLFLKIDQVTGEDIMRVAGKYFDEAGLVEVAVG